MKQIRVTIGLFESFKIEAFFCSTPAETDPEKVLAESKQNCIQRNTENEQIYTSSCKGFFIFRCLPSKHQRCIEVSTIELYPTSSHIPRVQKISSSHFIHLKRTLYGECR